MKHIPFSEFRKNASKLITDVEHGEVIYLTRHGKLIAEISPAEIGEKKIPSWKKEALRLAIRGEGLSTAILEEREAA